MSNGRSSAIVLLSTVMLIRFMGLPQPWHLESGSDLKSSFRYKHLLCLSPVTLCRQSLFLSILKSFISLLLCVKSLQILQAKYCRAANEAVVALTLPSSICPHTCSKGVSLSHLNHLLTPLSRSHSSIQISRHQTRSRNRFRWKPSTTRETYFYRSFSWSRSACSSVNTQSSLEAEHVHEGLPLSTAAFIYSSLYQSCKSLHSCLQTPSDNINRCLKC